MSKLKSNFAFQKQNPSDVLLFRKVAVMNIFCFLHSVKLIIPPDRIWIIAPLKNHILVFHFCCLKMIKLTPPSYLRHVLLIDSFLVSFSLQIIHPPLLCFLFTRYSFHFARTITSNYTLSLPRLLWWVAYYYVIVSLHIA